jgi:predicted Kef-type K+ transport protein
MSIPTTRTALSSNLIIKKVSNSALSLGKALIFTSAKVEHYVPVMMVVKEHLLPIKLKTSSLSND